MIIINLMDGLTNQMFQYAAGLVLSLGSNSSIIVEVDATNDRLLLQRSQLKNVFNRDINLARKKLFQLIEWRSDFLIRYLFFRLF